jgi:hypothetical protein
MISPWSWDRNQLACCWEVPLQSLLCFAIACTSPCWCPDLMQSVGLPLKLKGSASVIVSPYCLGLQGAAPFATVPYMKVFSTLGSIKHDGKFRPLQTSLALSTYRAYSGSKQAGMNMWAQKSCELQRVRS